MPNLISFPFRVTPAGYVATLPDDSSEYYSDELGLLVGTTPGERELVPSYGLNDPTFAQVDENELAVKVAMFGPPVQITNVAHKWVSSTQQDVTIEFEPVNRPRQ
jgi:hypothetical protein